MRTIKDILTRTWEYHIAPFLCLLAVYLFVFFAVAGAAVIIVSIIKAFK